MTTESPELKALLQSLMHPGLKAIDMSLGRIEQHLAAIGNPQTRIPPVVHVAGTNGKGSTIAFMRAILEAAGYRCHVFTSPHLVHFRERIIIAGETLDEPELIERLQRVQVRSTTYPLTFFEANAVAAFEAFSQYEADICLLEVGMGGRFDATNVIEQPALTVITPVSMDHQEYLGETLAKIAYEKAGIIKPGVPVVVAPQEAEAMEVIARVAAEKGAPLIEIQPRQHESLGLVGAHQQLNAATAEEAAKQLIKLGLFDIDQTSIQYGLAQAHWPGRLQRLSHGSLVDAAPQKTQIWLDGGHNASAAATLAEWARQQERPVHLICAMSDQKDAHAFLRILAPVMASIAVTAIPDEPLSMTPERLEQAARAFHTHVARFNTPTQAIAALPKGAIALICGSLYLAGWALQKNG